MSDGPVITTEMIIAKYIELRDEVEAITNAAAAQCAAKKTVMATLLAALKKKFNETGETSVKTDAGTAYVENVTACRVANWDTVIQFIKETENWGLLKRDVSKTAVSEYTEQNGVLPPGINWTVIKDVKVRRGK